MVLTLSRVTHICVSKLNTIGSDNGLSPDRRQDIIWTNHEILSFWPSGTNISISEFHTFSFTKMHFKMSSGKWRPCWLGLNVLTMYCLFCSFVSSPLSVMINLILWDPALCEPITAEEQNGCYNDRSVIAHNLTEWCGNTPDSRGPFLLTKIYTDHGIIK